MVEIIPKAAPKRPLWQDILFYSGIALLVLAIGAYFGLGYFEKEGQKTLRDLETQIATVRTKELVELKDELLAKEKKINDFSNLLNSHRQVSSLWSFLGKICHPRVRFLSLDFQAGEKEYRVSIPAEAESFAVLHQQMLILGQEELISKMEVTGISLGKEGGVNFNLTLSLSPKLFEFK